MYEIEAFEVKSVTDGENQWKKRPRSHDCPVPIKQMKIMKARYASLILGVETRQILYDFSFHEPILLDFIY